MLTSRPESGWSGGPRRAEAVNSRAATRSALPSEPGYWSCHEREHRAIRAPWCGTGDARSSPRGARPVAAEASTVGAQQSGPGAARRRRVRLLRRQSGDEGRGRGGGVAGRADGRATGAWGSSQRSRKPALGSVQPCATGPVRTTGCRRPGAGGRRTSPWSVVCGSTGSGWSRRGGCGRSIPPRNAMSTRGGPGGAATHSVLRARRRTPSSTRRPGRAPRRVTVPPAETPGGPVRAAAQVEVEPRSTSAVPASIGPGRRRATAGAVGVGRPGAMRRRSSS